MAMVGAGEQDTNVGGHYRPAWRRLRGFSHFWARAPPGGAMTGPDLLQPLWCRARVLFMLGRLTRHRDASARKSARASSSYLHPWLMPDFWQFPTVSMGLGPITRRSPGALHEIPGRPRPARRHAQAAQGGRSRRRRDGRGPNRLGAIGWRRARAWTTLIFVINCNLQRLDGPVRGNGKIIQELGASSAAPAGTSSR